MDEYIVSYSGDDFSSYIFKHAAKSVRHTRLYPREICEAISVGAGTVEVEGETDQLTSYKELVESIYPKSILDVKFCVATKIKQWTHTYGEVEKTGTPQFLNNGGFLTMGVLKQWGAVYE